MESYIRHFSQLEEYQHAHSIIYSLQSDLDGCRFRVVRTDWCPMIWESARRFPAHKAVLLLRFLYENCIPPELCHDTLEELL